MTIAALLTLGTFLFSVLAIVTVFLSFRSDYHGHPERTRIAVKLTLSTIKHALRLKRGEPPPAPDRRTASHDRRRFAEDMGTISAPIKAIPDPRTSDGDIDTSLSLKRSHRQPRHSPLPEPPDADELLPRPRRERE